MSVFKRLDQEAEDIARRVILDAAEETNKELKDCLKELKQLKNELGD